EVRLAPPGHTDFGFITTFAHCPRCRKEGGKRWVEKTRMSEREKCSACGYVYAPAEMCKDERDNFDVDTDWLERTLPPAEYATLREQWLQRHANDTPDNVTMTLRELNARSERSLLARLRRWIGID